VTDRPTALTRAFSGRLARGIVNGWMTVHPDAPLAYPEVHYLTASMRAEARAMSDTDRFNLWAGQAHSLARTLPAGELVQLLAEEAREALELARHRIDR
jgi:nitronate monooxygenase